MPETNADESWMRKLQEESVSRPPELSFKINIYQKKADGGLSLLGKQGYCQEPNNDLGDLVVNFELEAFRMLAFLGNNEAEIEEQREAAKDDRAKILLEKKAPAVLNLITEEFPNQPYKENDMQNPGFSAEKIYTFEVPKDQFWPLMGKLDRIASEFESKCKDRDQDAPAR